MTGGLVRAQFLLARVHRPAKRGRKTATIRLGDKSRKYQRGQIVWVTVGYQHSPREKIFTAVIDDVEVKRVRELSPRDIEHDNPEFRRLEETVGFLRQIYGRDITHEDTVTVIRFSQIVESARRTSATARRPPRTSAVASRRCPSTDSSPPGAGGAPGAGLGRDLRLRALA